MEESGRKWPASIKVTGNDRRERKRSNFSLPINNVGYAGPRLSNSVVLRGHETKRRGKREGDKRGGAGERTLDFTLPENRLEGSFYACE